MPNISEEINKLPKHIRDYIHDLETVVPADLIQELANLKENQEALIFAIKILERSAVK